MNASDAVFLPLEPLEDFVCNVDVDKEQFRNMPRYTLRLAEKHNGNLNHILLSGVLPTPTNQHLPLALSDLLIGHFVAMAT